MPKASQASIAPARREQLRRVMNLAWGLFRAEQRGPNPRTFADALAGAWRWVRGAAERALTGPMVGHVRLGSMVASPVRRSLTGTRYAGANAASSGYVAARFGR